ncbi:MAG: adenosylcobinamide-GDP ribazoletransferase [Deltaproteobacteria bacterium]|nr:adenosylcobinamide-GDP ribazoletransferase [Deltaproteobacteria bacterium]
MREISLSRRFVAAISFLTIFPLVVREGMSKEELGSSMALFPLVGLLLGALLWSCAYSFGAAFAPAVNALFLLSVLTIATRGLHLDGLADTLDGLGGGRDKREILKIMRDSHVGTFGVIGLVLTLMAKYLLISQLIEGESSLSLLLFPTLGRWSMVYLTWSFPYVRGEGTGAVFASYLSPRDFWWATGTALLISILTHGLAGAGTMALVWVFAYALGHYFVRRIGGITGDVMGAAGELAEILSLATLVALLRGI